jgi:DNA-binding winged helix-turn-helix (wHTH) protein
MRVVFDQFIFDGEARQLTGNGEAVHLSPKAFQLLQILIGKGPNAVFKHDLIAQIWPDVVVEEANLKVLINEVRKALSDDGRKPRLIRTVHRYGYAFAGHVASHAPRERTSARLLDESNVYPLSAGENSIGRDPQCAVVLNSLGVSRMHAMVDVSPQRIVLHDLGSKNGTAVNGVRITEPVELHNGDNICMGVTTLTFRSHPAPDSTVSVDMM